MFVNFEVPSSWCLFETIKSLNQSVKHMFLTSNLKTSRLIHINFFFKMNIEKDAHKIHLKYSPTKMISMSQNWLHCNHVDSGSKCFLIINPFLLNKNLCNQPCFELVKCTICIVIDHINPLATNRFLSVGTSSYAQV